VPVRFLSDVQRNALAGWPEEVNAEALERFFTLGVADLAEVRRRHGDANRVGWALQLCALRVLGFLPDDVRSAPSDAVRSVAHQLDIDPTALGAYGQRAQTRQDHAGQVRDYLGFRLARPEDLDGVRAWLTDQALVSDRPAALFRLACAQMYELRLVRPGVTAVEQQLVGVAREAARREVYRRLQPLLTAERLVVLDGLLVLDPDLGMTPARWLARRPVAASPKAMLGEVDKLVFLRDLGVEGWDVSVWPAKRATSLARWVEAASNQAVAQSAPERRYPGLLAYGAERLVEVTDGLVDLYARIVADTNAKARGRLREYRQSVAAAANDKVLLLAEIARALLDPDLEDDDRLAALFEAVPKDRLQHALADCERIARPADDHYVDLLGDHYSRLRSCVPRLLEVLAFGSSHAGKELLEGLEVLRELNRTGRRSVPLEAPMGFVPKTWLPFVVSAEDNVSRRFWELALLWRLRDGLRSGDVWLEGSRRWADPETYLLDQPTWAGLRTDYCATVERPASARLRLERLGDELDEELAGFAEMLAAGSGPARLDGDRLVVPRDVGDDIPASAAELKVWVKELLPLVELAEVVIQIDAECGFSEHLLHAAGAKSRTPAMLAHLYVAILAQATNLGPEAMARASGLSYEQIAHATSWYLREETLTIATDAVVNHHHRTPISRLWGHGSFSSSDGQRFPVEVPSAHAVALPRYFGHGRGITAYTWVSDHYATYATKVVETSLRDATFVLDGIFGLEERDSELDIAEHTTDTAGYTDLVFAVFDLVGLKFSPRIRDLADQRLWYLERSAVPTLVGPLMRQRASTEQIAEHWCCRQDWMRTRRQISAWTVRQHCVERRETAPVMA
jgi:TnpA family transposase